MTPERAKQARRSAARTPEERAGADRGRGVTIKDVARAAAVSPTTVSNVMNGNLDFVSDQTRRRVEREISRLNYRVMSSGRNLRLGRRHALGIIIVDELDDFMSNPFISRFVSGLCGFLNQRDYVMIVQGIRPEEFAHAFPLKRAEADAYCIRLNGHEGARRTMLSVLDRIAEPVALVQETLPPQSADRCVVRQDDYGGGMMLADHLAARGARNVLAVVPRFSGPMTSSRLAGLRDGFEAAGAPARIEVLMSDVNSFGCAYEAVWGALARRQPPQAILGANDELALAALRAAQDRKLNVPDDLLVAGFNGFQPPSYSRPTLTTVVSQAAEIGALSGECLLRRLDRGSFEQREIVLPVSFRKGDST